MKNLLSALSKAFADWNKSKCSYQGKNKRYPKTLKKQAVDCLQHYSREEIVSATGIARSTLSKWTQLYSGSSDKHDGISHSHLDNTFVELPCIEPPSLHHDSQLLITLPNNLKININGYSQLDTIKLISSLTKEEY